MHHPAIFRRGLTIGVGIVVGLLYMNSGGRAAPKCELDAVHFSDSSSWRIATSSIPAQILWQEAEDKTPTHDILWRPNSGLTAFGEQLLYWWEPNPNGTFLNLLSESSRVVALDAQSGDQQWCFIPGGLLRRITAIEGGYIVIVSGMVYKLDSRGSEIWSNADLPTRAIDTLDETPSAFFAPSYTQVYELSKQTGEVTKVIPINSPINFWEDFAVTAAQDDAIQILDLAKSKQAVAIIRLFNSVPLRNYLSNLRPFTGRHKDILFLYYNAYRTPNRIEAYQINTGKFLWAIDVKFYGLPVVLGNSFILYTADGLTVYDVRNGKSTGNVKMVRVVNGIVESGLPNDVWLAGSGDMVFINYRDTWEIVALKIGVPVITPTP